MNCYLKTLLGVSFALLLWIFAAPFIANGLVVEKRIGKADAMYVMSGSKAYRQRAALAAHLYEQDISKLIVLTDDGGRAGWSQEKQTNPRFVDLTAEYLKRLGVKEDDIHVVEAVVGGTEDEAEIVSEFVREEGFRSLLVVTSKYHTGRAYKSFEPKIRTKNVELGITGTDEGEPGIWTWWLNPAGWKVVAGEYLKTAAYYVFF